MANEKAPPRITDTCPKHGSVEFVIRSDGGSKRCTRCRSEAVQKRRDRVKRMAVTYLGGKCQRCGWNEHQAGLVPHHMDPSTKSFAISKKGYTRAWAKVREELDKCVLLCANCHHVVHATNDPEWIK